MIVMVMGLLLASCSKSVDILGDQKSNYHKTLKQHSREKRFYGLERVPYMTQVVYLSEKLRRAYVDEYAHKYRSSTQEKGQQLKKQLDEAAQYDEFVVFHFATDSQSPRESNLGFWRLRLIDRYGKTHDPKHVGTLLGDAATLQYFYPQMSPWSKNYLVRFEKIDVQDQMKLTMDSVDANLEFVWLTQ